jgi:16S rRNA (guanine966-N2)-methyltransferase
MHSSERRPITHPAGLRIVGGVHRGRRLATPLGDAVRPTSDRTRQALFNILSHGSFAASGLPFADRPVLDAFAGTGAFGLEALSRGAGRASFIEHNRAALAALRANVAACRAEGRSRVIAADATRPPRGAPHRLVFLDPPYGRGLVLAAALALQKTGWIAPGALLVAELGRDEPAPALGEILAERSHGAARISVWRAGGTDLPIS